MKKLAAALILILMLPFFADGDEYSLAYWFYDYDLDSDSMTFGRVLGKNGGVVNPEGIPVGPQIETDGSDTDVVETVADTDPFALLDVDDILLVRRQTSVDSRVITTKTDAANVAVHTAVDWTGGFNFSWLDQQTGTGVDVGWIDLSNWTEAKAVVLYRQGDLATALLAQFECRDSYKTELTAVSKGYLHFPASGTMSFATAGANVGTVIRIPESTGECRMGIARDGADTADTTTAREYITAYLVGKLRR